MSRTVTRSLLGVRQSEGKGASVRRSIGRPELRNLDPFLLLDDFEVKLPAGFPDHPHRGFETVAYMLSGSFLHEDFLGHKGVINEGDLQWMTAGRGVVHLEMPHGDKGGHGLQLWVNLSKENKMVPPSYQELQDKEIPRASKDGVTAKIIAGEAFSVKSPIFTKTPTMYIDFNMPNGTSLTQDIPLGWNAFVYVLQGSAMFGPEGSEKKGDVYCTLVLGEGDGLYVHNKESEMCRFVLIAGKPLKEPVVQHGPFVMTTNEEIKQALMDYKTGKNGFENAQSWASDYTKEKNAKKGM